MAIKSLVSKIKMIEKKLEVDLNPSKTVIISTNNGQDIVVSTEIDKVFSDSLNDVIDYLNSININTIVMEILIGIVKGSLADKFMLYMSGDNQDTNCYSDYELSENERLSQYQKYYYFDENNR